MKTLALAAVAVFLSACPASPAPEDRPCLRCGEVGGGDPARAVRDQERFLCAAAWGTWDPLLQGRCAPSLPCAAACSAWCAGGAVDRGCADCTAALLAPELDACERDLPF